MSLVKFGREDQIGEGQRIVKECYERCLALVKSNGDYTCYELPDTSLADCEVDQFSSIDGVRTHQVLNDDGEIWVSLAEKPCGPVVEREFMPPSQESLDGITAADVPPPLVPFAGREQAPMPPSPARPFAGSASPFKPSPFKDRVDAATSAVVKVTAARRGINFSAAPPPPRRPVAAGTADV